MTPGRRTAQAAFVALPLALFLANCGTQVQPTPAQSIASAPSPPAAPNGVSLTDLSVIGCAGDDPGDEGELTGAWAGSDSGVYYIRQVGDCVWWFGTEVKEIEPGATYQRGFANVASGRIVGTQVDLEWADVPLGDTVNAGGLTFTYNQAGGQLTLNEQRGGTRRFGGTVLTRIEPDASPDASPVPSPTP